MNGLKYIKYVYLYGTLLNNKKKKKKCFVKLVGLTQLRHPHRK